MRDGVDDGTRRASREEVVQRPSCRRTFLALVAGSLIAVPAQAADWRVEPRLVLEELLTDNVTLAPSGFENGDLVTDISPGIRIRRLGPRLELFADASVQRLIYADNSRFNETNFRGQLDSETELVEDLLFLKAGATYTQQNESSEGRITDSNAFATGNRSDVFTYAVAPILRRRFGNVAQGELRLERNEVQGSGTIEDSEAHRMDASLVSGSRFTRLPWRIIYSGERIEDDFGTDRFQRVRGEVDYQLSRIWTALGSVGYEDNDVAGEGGDVEKGTTWFVGVRWTPSPRTLLRVTAGHRFFGTDLDLQFSHRSRRTRWTLSAGEDIESSRASRLESRPFVFVDDFGEPLTDPVSGQPLLGTADVLVPENEIRVNRRLNGAMEFTGRRTTFTLRVGAVSRDFQRSGGNEEELSASFVVTRALSRRMGARASGGWRTTEFRDGREDDFWELQLGLARRLTPDVDLDLVLAHQRQDSTDGADEYDETSATARLRVSF
jgi:uncharacterized protein (PEP-CTERM system associated)